MDEITIFDATGRFIFSQPQIEKKNKKKQNIKIPAALIYSERGVEFIENQSVDQSFGNNLSN